MIKISIDQNALKKLEETLGKGVKGLDDFRKPFNEFDKLLSAEQKKNFDQQGAIYQGGDFIRLGGAFANLSHATTRSAAWQKLAESTKRDRAYHGYNAARPILIRTGKLKGSFKSTIGKTTFVTENTAPYANAHQNGGERLPQRRIMGFSQKAVQALTLAFENYIISIFDMEGHGSPTGKFVKIK